MTKDSFNDLGPEISRRKRVAWVAYNSVIGLIESCRDWELRANVFNFTVLLALCYACKTCAVTKAQKINYEGCKRPWKGKWSASSTLAATLRIAQ